MRKLLAVVGTNAKFSYNRLLAKFVAKHYQQQAKIEVAEVKDLPPYVKHEPANQAVQAWRAKVQAADGLIICTPEYDRAIPAALKSALEWLGLFSGANVMAGKPVMILGVSLGMMGSSNAQEDLREILLSPDLAATVLPGNEVLISYANRNFNQNTGELTSEKFIQQLDLAFAHFLDYIDTGWRK